MKVLTLLYTFLPVALIPTLLLLYLFISFVSRKPYWAGCVYTQVTNK